MTQEYYVFNTEQQAIDAEAFISTNAGFPLAGTNLKTGLVDSAAQKTERWAIPQQRINDNKWVFPVVPITRILELMKPEQAQVLITQYNTDYPHALETSNSTWWPEIDD